MRKGRTNVSGTGYLAKMKKKKLPHTHNERAAVCVVCCMYLLPFWRARAAAFPLLSAIDSVSIRWYWGSSPLTAICCMCVYHPFALPTPIQQLLLTCRLQMAYSGRGNVFRRDQIDDYVVHFFECSAHPFRKRKQF